jgi:hypothetical protein
MPRAMAWADGTLYQASYNGIKAVPERGGEATTIVADSIFPDEMWVQGENLLFARWEQLVQVPRSGGVAEILLDGGEKNDQRSGEDYVPDHHLLDGSHFYWTTEDASSSHSTDATYVWRMPLAGGPVESVGEVPVRNGDGMALTSDGLLLSGWYGDSQTGAFLLPRAGGPSRVLDRDPEFWRFVGMDSGGVLWTQVVSKNAEENTTLPIELSPADGSPHRPLSRELPDGFVFPLWSYPDGQGGRFLFGEEVFDDNSTHPSVFFVAADGRATRLACEPTRHVVYTHGLALSPEALFMVEEFPDRWQVVRIARPVPTNVAP